MWLRRKAARSRPDRLQALLLRMIDMADTWRVRECVNQLLLFFAFEAWSAKTTKADKGQLLAAPLRPFNDMARLPWAKEQIARIVSNPGAFKPLQRMAAVEKNVSTIESTPPWSIGDLVEWWIMAGIAVAGWRKTGIEPQLLSAVGLHMLLEDDETYPALWCADHVTEWNLVKPDAARRPIGWQEKCTRREDCIEALLDWCGDPRRDFAAMQSQTESPMDASAQAYRDRYRDFARSSLRLLRTGCRFGTVRDLPSKPQHWRVHGGIASPQHLRVLRPPLYKRAESDGRPVVVGWVTKPWPAQLVAEFRQSVEERSPVSGSIKRAIERAGMWGIQERSFGAMLSGSDIAPITTAAGDGDVIRAKRLAALASLVTASKLDIRGADAAPTDDPLKLDLAERIRWSAALEDLVFEWRAALDHGAGRLIPYGEGLTWQAAGEKSTLRLSWAAGIKTATVGAVGDAARCPDDLLASIEDVDWSWWSLCTLRYAARGDAELEAVVASAGPDEWETVKRQLVVWEAGSTNACDTLATAHRAIHRWRLGVERIASDHPPGAVANEYAAALRRLEREICRLLASGDPAGIARLHPPRTADGQVAVGEWIRTRGHAGATSPACDVSWEISAKPFGRPLSESLESDGRVRLVLSAGPQASADDVRLLGAPGVMTGDPPFGDETIVAPLRTAIALAVRGDAPIDISAAIKEMREAFSGTLEATFDRLVSRAIDGDAASSAWVRLMHAERRFDFACHPSVTIGEAGIVLNTPAVSDDLEWRDDATVGTDKDIEVCFATEASRARRVLSRGQPASGSLEALAANLVDHVRGGLEDMMKVAVAVQKATDRGRMFRLSAAELVVEALTLANLLAARADHIGDRGLATFQSLTRWCKAAGVALTPAEWHPSQGTSAEGLGVDRFGFHATVPPGRVVVERFGAIGSDGAALASLEAFVSAGPAPSGYEELQAVVAALEDDGDAVRRLCDRVRDFPSWVHCGQGTTKADVLFDVVWKAVMRSPEREDLRRAADAVHRFLDRSYNLIVFEPKTVGEYQEGWMQTADGGRPQGLRVEQLLRPGLRTIENKLKWPAIVETR